MPRLAPANYKLRPFDINAIVLEFQAGSSIKELANIYRVNKSTIRYHLVAQGTYTPIRRKKTKNRRTSKAKV